MPFLFDAGASVARRFLPCTAGVRLPLRRLVALSAVFLSAALLADAPAQARTVSQNALLPQSAADGTRDFADGAQYALCFTPDGESCQSMLIDAIGATRRTLLIQAYSFTSKPIAEALLRARKRGVKVRVIVDKSQATARYTSATFLKNQGIEVVIDRRPAIAHNKVMIFDGEAVFTGSFNFTKAAEERNTENGILIRGDQRLVTRYLRNWETRHRLSEPY